MIIPTEWTGSIGVDLGTPVTQAEIDAHPQWRGQYVAGQDTRDFVVQQETSCEAYNCWMHRDGTGAPFYVSEVLSPAQLTALLPAISGSLAPGAVPLA